MPNQPRPDNPARQVRVEDELWEAAKATAADRGTTVSAVIRDALRRFVTDQDPLAAVERLLDEREGRFASATVRHWAGPATPTVKTADVRKALGDTPTTTPPPDDANHSDLV